jgi:hypothetical protein
MIVVFVLARNVPLSLARLIQSTSHPVFIKGTDSAPSRLSRGLWWMLFVKPSTLTEEHKPEHEHGNVDEPNKQPPSYCL